MSQVKSMELELEAINERADANPANAYVLKGLIERLNALSGALFRYGVENRGENAKRWVELFEVSIQDVRENVEAFLKNAK